MATQPLPDMAQRLIEAAIDQFGRLGFEGASTRDIAAACGTAMSSITYHFGGKQGLYLACADHIAHDMAELHAPAIRMAASDMPSTAEAARTFLATLVETFARRMLSPKSRALSQFIAREQQHPTEAFARIYAHTMGPTLEATARIVAVARPSLDEKARRALVINILGMALALRLARATTARFMGVDDLDEATSEILLASLRRSTLALLTED